MNPGAMFLATFLALWGCLQLLSNAKQKAEQ